MKKGAVPNLTLLPCFLCQLALSYIHHAEDNSADFSTGVFHGLQAPIPIGDSSFRMFGIFKGFLESEVRFPRLHHFSEYRLVLLVGIEGKMVLANEELRAAIVSFGIRAVDTDEVEFCIHVGDHEVDA